jgi:hypothetical protein
MRPCSFGDAGRLKLLGGFRQRLLNRRGVALVRALHGDADDRAGVEIDGVFGFVRQMRPAVLHLCDLGVGIVRMGPVVIRALLLPFPIDPRQVGARRRPDARGLGERSQKLLIALAAVSSHDASQRRIRFQRGGVDTDRLAFDQASRTETLQDPRKHGAMRFERDQPACPRNRRVVRWRLVEADAQTIAQRQRVRRAPRDAALGVNALEIADQQQPETDSRWHSRPAHGLGIKPDALRFDEIIEAVFA